MDKTPKTIEVEGIEYAHTPQWDTWRWVADKFLAAHGHDCAPLTMDAEACHHFARIMEWIDPINRPMATMNNGSNSSND